MSSWIGDTLWFLAGAMVTAIVFLMKHALPWIKHWKEGRGEHQAKKTIKAMLYDSSWKMRRYSTIARRTAGIDDDTRRRILTELGGVSMQSKSGEELWGLRKRLGNQLEAADHYAGQMSSFHEDM